MGWLADYLLIANLAQLGFVAHLIGGFLPDMARHVLIGRHAVRAACNGLAYVRLARI
jgi:mediator of RNA polymerase II transcription subunit 12